MQGKQKRGPCLCCSQVAVSVTAAHVWLERLGIVSAASLTLAANLIPAAFEKLFESCFCTSCVPFSGLEELPKEVQEGRIVKNNFKETRIEPRKMGPVLIILRCLLLEDELFHCQLILFRGRKRDVQGPGIESRSG